MGNTIGLILALKDQCSPQLKNIAEKIGITEKEAKKLNVQIGKLSKDLGGKLKGACTAVGVGLGAVVSTAGVVVNKTAELGDRVDKLSQKIGLSRQGFQEWDYVCSQSGMQIESLQMGMKTLVNKINGVATGNKGAITTFNKLGVSVKDSSGKLKNQEQVFNECVMALTKMKNGSEKAKIANELFGRSGAELAPIIQGTGETITELKDRAHKLGLVMGDELVDNCVEYGDLMDDMKKASTMLGAGIASGLLPSLIELQKTLINELPKIRSTLTPVLTGVGNVVKFLIEHFKGLSIIASICLTTFVAYKVVSGVITTITLFAQVMSMAGSATKLLTFMLQQNQAFMLAQVTWTKLCAVAQMAFNATLFGCPLMLIVGGIALVTAGIVVLIQHWDGVKNAVTGFVTTAVQKIQSLWEKIKPIFEKIRKGAEIAFAFTPLGMAVNAGKAVANAVNKPKKNALGTSFSTGGTTLVGEHGAELVNLPKGASVTTANNTQKALKSNGGINIQVTIMGNMVGNNEFLNQMGNMFAQKLKVAMAVR